MKRLLSIFLLVAAFGVNAQQPFTINGTIKGLLIIPTMKLLQVQNQRREV